MLCANCHREEHYQIKTYSNTEAPRLQSVIANKEIKPTWKCLICEKDVYGTKYCSYECARFARRKVKRPTKDVLKQELSEYSMEALGRKYNVTGTAVRKWAIAYGLRNQDEGFSI